MVIQECRNQAQSHRPGSHVRSPSDVGVGLRAESASQEARSHCHFGQPYCNRECPWVEGKWTGYTRSEAQQIKDCVEIRIETMWKRLVFELGGLGGVVALVPFNPVEADCDLLLSIEGATRRFPWKFRAMEFNRTRDSVGVCEKPNCLTPLQSEDSMDLGGWSVMAIYYRSNVAKASFAEIRRFSAGRLAAFAMVCGCRRGSARRFWGGTCSYGIRCGSSTLPNCPARGHAGPW